MIDAAKEVPTAVFGSKELPQEPAVEVERTQVTQTTGKVVSSEVDVVVAVLTVSKIENTSRVVSPEQVNETRRVSL